MGGEGIRAVVYFCDLLNGKFRRYFLQMPCSPSFQSNTLDH